MSITTFIFDTLQFVKKMREAGMPEKQAEIQAETIAGVMENNLASKQDLQQVETTLRQEVLNTKNELELKMAELKSELIKWVLGVSVAQAAVIISCVKLIN